MKYCKKCGEKIPSTIIIDNKIRNLSHRMYCLKCSPFNKHNTSKLHEFGEGKQDVCKYCKKEFIYNRSKGHRKHICNSCVTKIKKKEVKIKSINYKGGKCQKCGYKKCFDSLCFHHKNPQEKEFNISTNYNRSWESIKKELDKCDLLCLNCHAEEHAKINKRSLV